MAVSDSSKFISVALLTITQLKQFLNWLKHERKQSTKNGSVSM